MYSIFNQLRFLFLPTSVTLPLFWKNELKFTIAAEHNCEDANA